MAQLSPSLLDLFSNYFFPSLENGSEVGESDEDDEAAPEMEDVVAETEEVLAESFKCLKPGCREEGTAFSNAAELEKHEK